MATKIATVSSLEGKFFAKDKDGNVVELKNGDTISKDMTVFGDKNNPASANIKFVMNDGANEIVLTGTQEQAFDSSLNDEPSHESGLSKESIEKALIKELYAQEDKTDTKEEDLGILDETAAGEEQAKQNEGGEGQFEARDAGQTDIVAGLRDASFGGTDDGEKPDGEQKIPLNAELSIDGMTLVHEGDSATYTLSVTDAPVSDMLVSVRVSHIDTDNGDIVEETIIVTIPANSKIGTFTIDNFDNNFEEADEDYSVTIISTEGGGYDVLTIGKDSVTTTIIDETSTGNPDPEDTTTVAITTADVNEDDNFTTFNIELSNPPKTGVPTTVQVQIGNTTHNVVVDADGKGSLQISTKDSDVYKESDVDMTATVTGVTGGDYEKVVVGQSATSTLEDTVDTTTVSLIATQSTSEDAGIIIYTVSIDNKANNNVDVTLSVGANGEVASANNPALVITIPAGQLTASTNATVSRDNDDGSGEDKYQETDSVSAKIVSAVEDNAGSVTSLEELAIDGTPAVTTIVDDADAISVSITTSNITEDDNSITYNVQLSAAPDPTTYDNANKPTVQVEINGTTYNVEVDANGSGVLNFAVTPDSDVLKEADTTVSAKVTGVTGGNFEAETVGQTATATIKDSIDTVYARISHSDTSAEGDSLTHTVELYTIVNGQEVAVEVPANESVTISLNYANNNQDALENTDLSTKQPTVTISGGNSSAVITNVSLHDNIDELDESYTITLGAVTQSPFEKVVTQGEADGTIIDYDRLVVEDDSNDADGDGIFNVALFDATDAIFISDENNGSVYESITISGIPSDAILKDHNGNQVAVVNGTVILTNTLGEIRAFTITPATDSSENIYLSYTVTSNDGATQTFTDTFDQTVRIIPDADQPITQGDKSYGALEGDWISLSGLSAAIGETNTSNNHDNENLVTKIDVQNNIKVQYRWTDDNGVIHTSNNTKGAVEIPQKYLDTVEVQTKNDDWNGTLTFKMTTVATDNDELNNGETNIDTATELDTLTVTVSGSADAPIINVSGGAGLEDAGRNPDTGVISANGVGGIAIELGAFTDGGTESIEFIISDIPDDAFIYDANGTLLNPMVNGNYVGTITVALADASGLTVVPPHDSNVDFDLTVVGKSTEGNWDTNIGGLQTNLSAPKTLTIALTGVIDALDVEVNNIGGAEDSWVSFGLKASSGEDVASDTSESIYATLKGVPKGSEIRIVDANGVELPLTDNLTLAGVYADGSTDWRIDNDVLAALNNGTKDFQIKLKADFSGEIKIGLDVTATENDGDTTSVQKDFILNIAPVVDTADGSNTQEVTEDTWTHLDLPMGTNDSNSESVVEGTAVLSGIPTGFSIKVDGVLQDTSSGSLSLTNAEASLVTILAPENSNVDVSGLKFTRDILDESVKDSQHDGDDEVASSSVVQSISLDLVGVADGWTDDGFEVQDVTSAGNTTLLTNVIQTNNNIDTDGSETKYYIVENQTGVTDNPNWSIENGVNLGGGRWLVTEANLNNANIKVYNHGGSNDDGTAQLQISPCCKRK